MKRKKMRKRKMRKRRRRKTLNFFLALHWGHLSTPDPPGLEAACPSSQPQDLRVKRGEGGPLPQEPTPSPAPDRPPWHPP